MAKYRAKGAVLEYQSGGTYVPIVNLGDFELPLGETEDIDVTTHDSPDNTREFIESWRVPGEISITVKWDPEALSHTTLRGLVGTRKVFRMTPPEGTTRYLFTAIVKNFTLSNPVDGALEATIPLRLTGAVTEEAIP